MERFFPSSSYPPAAATPSYLPLTGVSRQQAADLLRRKGAVLSPQLSAAEALQIVQYMRLEQFAANTWISFDVKSQGLARLMLVLVGEVNIRLRDTGHRQSKYSPVDQQARWAAAGEGATLGLVHAFSGFSSQFLAQATTQLFVASLTREAQNLLVQEHPLLGARWMEMLARELAFIALEHERNLQAMNNLARSMQNMIDAETSKTTPGALG